MVSNFEYFLDKNSIRKTFEIEFKNNKKIISVFYDLKKNCLNELSKSYLKNIDNKFLDFFIIFLDNLNVNFFIFKEENLEEYLFGTFFNKINIEFVLKKYSDKFLLKDIKIDLHVDLNQKIYFKKTNITGFFYKWKFQKNKLDIGLKQSFKKYFIDFTYKSIYSNNLKIAERNIKLINQFSSFKQKLIKYCPQFFSNEKIFYEYYKIINLFPDNLNQKLKTRLNKTEILF